MNFQHRPDLKVNIDDWYVYLLWTGHPFGHEVAEKMEWFEDNIESSFNDQTYALWYDWLDSDSDRRVYYVSFKHEEDAMAFKLRWT